jgi:hypothetical protein
MAKGKAANKPVSTELKPVLVLEDIVRETRKRNAQPKLNQLKGLAFKDLSQKQKDELLEILLLQAGIINAGGVIL